MEPSQDNQKKVKVTAKTKVKTKSIVVMAGIVVGLLWLGFTGSQLLNSQNTTVGLGGSVIAPTEINCPKGQLIHHDASEGTLEFGVRYDCCADDPERADGTDKECWKKDANSSDVGGSPYCHSNKCSACRDDVADCKIPRPGDEVTCFQNEATTAFACIEWTPEVEKEYDFTALIERLESLPPPTDIELLRQQLENAGIYEDHEAGDDYFKDFAVKQVEDQSRTPWYYHPTTYKSHNDRWEVELETKWKGLKWEYIGIRVSIGKAGPVYDIWDENHRGKND